MSETCLVTFSNVFVFSNSTGSKEEEKYRRRERSLGLKSNMLLNKNIKDRSGIAINKMNSLISFLICGIETSLKDCMINMYVLLSIPQTMIDATLSLPDGKGSKSETKKSKCLLFSASSEKLQF